MSMPYALPDCFTCDNSRTIPGRRSCSRFSAALFLSMLSWSRQMRMLISTFWVDTGLPALVCVAQHFCKFGQVGHVCLGPDIRLPSRTTKPRVATDIILRANVIYNFELRVFRFM